MASASKTQNLNLPQWVGTEKPERTDFNAAFLAIDGAATSDDNYVKFPDGTMICWGVVGVDTSSTGMKTATWTFPQTFSAVPVVTATVGLASAAGLQIIDKVAVQRQVDGYTSSCGVYYDVLAIAGVTMRIHVMAIGRWKA